MKRIGDIYCKIIDKNNIRQAILNASKGKRKRANVTRIIENEVYYTELLHQKLKNKTFEPSKYEKIKIQDGVRKKERIIFKPAFYPDEVVHWALIQQIEPIIMRGMYEFCCGSIKGRGIMHGMKYLKKILIRDRKNTKYCLKLDVKKFYPSINQNVLKRKFMRIIKDRYTLDLIDKIIDSGESGLPIR